MLSCYRCAMQAVLNLSAIDSMHATLSRRCDYSRHRVTLAAYLTRYQSWFTLCKPSIDDACYMLSMMYICCILCMLSMMPGMQSFDASACYRSIKHTHADDLRCMLILWTYDAHRTCHWSMVHAIYRLCRLSICDTCSCLISLSPVCLIFSVCLTTPSIWLCPWLGDRLTFSVFLTHLPMSLIGLLDLLCLPYHFVCLTHFVYLTITAYFTCRLFDSPCLLDSVVGWLPLSGWHTCLYSLLVCLTLSVLLLRLLGSRCLLHSYRLTCRLSDSPCLLYSEFGWPPLFT